MSMATKSSLSKPSKTTNDLASLDFVDRMLLAIIEAHPGSGNLSRPRRIKERSTRLAAARRALLNDKRNSREIIDYTALEFMARDLEKDQHKRRWVQFQRNAGNNVRSDPPLTSVRQLAKRSAHLADGIGTSQSTEDRLRTKFSKHKKLLSERARESYKNDLRRLAEDQILREVAVLLEPYLTLKIQHMPKRTATFVSKLKRET